MDVTDVLRDRMQEPLGLQRMVSVSLALHVALAAGLALTPRGWIGRPVEPPRSVMTISLSGAGEGPRNGGLTPAPGRSVQTAVPPEQLPKREVAQAPAAKTPEMTIPKPNARPTKARPEVEQAPSQARGRTPTSGAQATPGNSIANTPIRGQGFAGLSTGGGAGTGSSLDVGDFCCPEYLNVMVDRIKSVWAQNQGATGQVLVKYTIQRNGQIMDASVETSSGTSSLDLAALRAVLQTKSLPPLPDGFTNATLTVHLSFEYR